MKAPFKNILLGVTGGIACYKSVELVRRLKEAHFDVRVVLTEHATRFITPLTFQAVSGHPVVCNWSDESTHGMDHIALARWADAILIAPATANTIAKLAHGLADEVLGAICLATRAPIVLAPAMNTYMWQNPATQANVTHLKTLGMHLIPPDSGEQACGEVGPGRLPEVSVLLNAIFSLQDAPLLKGTRVLITAGPTQEAIDPVRFLSNASSGKMGFALAEAAKRLGADVTLIHGPVSLPAPSGVTTKKITTAAQMQQAVMQALPQQDIFISVAAVADYQPIEAAPQKIKKTADTLTLTLVKTPDILSEAKARFPDTFMVGFAAETHDVLEKATQKQAAKNIEMIIANAVGHNLGFGEEANEVWVIDKASTRHLPKQPKVVLARTLIEWIANAYAKTTKKHPSQSPELSYS